MRVPVLPVGGPDFISMVLRAESGVTPRVPLGLAPKLTETVKDMALAPWDSDVMEAGFEQGRPVRGYWPCLAPKGALHVFGLCSSMASGTGVGPDAIRPFWH